MGPGAEPSRWFADAPVADGRKVVISDTDHYAPGAGDALWAWKSFLRGHHPILMDFGLIDGPEPSAGGNPDAGVPDFETYEPARYAMGDTRRFAERMSLVDTEPRPDIASTGYALADPGRQLLTLDPAGGSPFTVVLEAGQWQVEWYDVTRRVRMDADPVEVVDAGPAPFSAPFGGAAVLLLTMCDR